MYTCSKCGAPLAQPTADGFMICPNCKTVHRVPAPPTTPPKSNKPIIITLAVIAAVAVICALFAILYPVLFKKDESKVKPDDSEASLEINDQPSDEGDKVTTDALPEQEKEDKTEQLPDEPKEEQKPSTEVTVGSFIKFGKYEQDNNVTNGKEDIDWVVLDTQDGYALVMSAYALDCKPYNTGSYKGVTWQSSTLRAWLNGEFMSNAFTAEEMSKIRTDGNGDRVRLLGTTELAYFDTQEQMKCTPTPYAVANGAWSNAETGYCWWWLLSPDNGIHTANYVNSEGKVFTENYETYDADSSVRPVMWVSLDK